MEGLAAEAAAAEGICICRHSSPLRRSIVVSCWLAAGTTRLQYAMWLMLGCSMVPGCSTQCGMPIMLHVYLYPSCGTCVVQPWY